MSRKRTLLHNGAPVAAILLALAVPGFGQDAGNAVSQSTAKGPTAGQTTASGSQSAADSSATGSQGPNSGKPAPVCFKLTGRCVEQSSKSGKGSSAPTGSTAQSPAGSQSAAGTGSASSAAGTQAAAPRQPLNLTAPDVSSVVPADELKEPLPTADQITEKQESETVSVEGDKSLNEVPLGFGALWWALNHPSQAWRILAPVQ